MLNCLSWYENLRILPRISSRNPLDIISEILLQLSNYSSDILQTSLCFLVKLPGTIGNLFWILKKKSLFDYYENLPGFLREIYLQFCQKCFEDFFWKYCLAFFCISRRFFRKLLGVFLKILSTTFPEIDLKLFYQSLWHFFRNISVILPYISL